MHKTEIGARGTERDRSNLSECVCVLGGDELNFKQPLTASGVLCVSVFASLFFSFSLPD